MSLKAVHKVLRAARNGDVVLILDARDALKEISALEKAAKEMVRLTLAVPQDLLTSGESEAIATMRSIAKEAK